MAEREADDDRGGRMRGDGAVPSTCPSCGGTAFSPLFVPRYGITFHVCRACGLHINPGPQGWEDATDEGGYEEEYQARYHARRRHKVFSSLHTLNLIEDVLSAADRPVPGVLLDVGCSVGAFLEAATTRGWDARGIDISRHAVDFCRRRGLKAASGSMRHIEFADDTFDVLNLRHVLEHVPDPNACVRESARVLKPGGVLVLTVPSVDGWKVRVLGGRYSRVFPPEHYYVFSSRSTANIMQRARLRRLSVPSLGRRWHQVGASGATGYVLWRSLALVREVLGLRSDEMSVWQK